MTDVGCKGERKGVERHQSSLQFVNKRHLQKTPTRGRALLRLSSKHLHHSHREQSHAKSGQTGTIAGVNQYDGVTVFSAIASRLDLAGGQGSPAGPPTKRTNLLVNLRWSDLGAYLDSDTRGKSYLT